MFRPVFGGCVAKHGGRSARLNPGLDFREGDMLALDLQQAVWQASSPFMRLSTSLPERLSVAFGEMFRALNQRYRR